MPERIIEENDEFRDVEATSDDWDPDAPPPGAWRSVRREWKVENEETRREALERRALQALGANREYLALTSPTASDVRQQVALVTRECSALIRLLLRELDATD